MAGIGISLDIVNMSGWLCPELTQMLGQQNTYVRAGTAACWEHCLRLGHPWTGLRLEDWPLLSSAEGARCARACRGGWAAPRTRT